MTGKDALRRKNKEGREEGTDPSSQVKQRQWNQQWRLRNNIIRTAQGKSQEILKSIMKVNSK